MVVGDSRVGRRDWRRSSPRVANRARGSCPARHDCRARACTPIAGGTRMNTVVDVAADEMPTGIPLSERGPAQPRVIAGFGFWLFLLSDIIIFSALFAAYAVLSSETNAGPSPYEL